MSRLHESLTLFISSSFYHLIGGDRTLIIDRTSNKISSTKNHSPPIQYDQHLTVYGIFGIIQLIKSDYLIVITKHQQTSTLLSTPIYTPTDFAIFPIDRTAATSLLAHPEEAYLLSCLKSHLFSAPFYYSYGGYNVTCRLQEQKNLMSDDAGTAKAAAFWETCDDRFFWNRHMQSRLIEAHSATQDLSKFILPVMFGYFAVQSTSINSRPMSFALISRRNRFRAGTRYFSRGIDLLGHVSNFNETEQIVVLDSQSAGASSEKGSKGGGNEIRFSFVQTRGSVPVYWAEINNLRYKPDLKIMDLSTTAESLRLHFEQQISLYGDQYLINLVNQSGYEKPVKEAYERSIEAMKNPRVHYTYFDFHHECKGLRFDRVDRLIDGLDRELHEQSYFYHDTTASSTTPQRTQTSVVRTNCMDCLDRTNVVQSALGKWVLNNQLRQIGVLAVKESIDDHATFLHMFRNLWADNADVVSRAYSGTGALKTDYTRTGKRSTEGALQDGINSVMRYVKNNFLDGPRQDAYDLVTGGWIPRKGQTPWRDERILVTRLAPFVIAITSFIVFIALFAPATAPFLPSRFVSIISLFIAAFAIMHVLNNGIDYIAWPRLKLLEETIHYTGKGYESGRRGRPLRIVHSSGGEMSSRRAAAGTRESAISVESKRD